jgi:putative spermidine/putrescine transport system substrate-binding protein
MFKRANSMRHFAASVLVALTASLSAQSSMGADLVVAAWGGIWEQSFRQCIVAPFEKKTGKTVDVVLGTPAQWLNQVAASPAKPPIDVIFVQPDGALDAVKRGLVVKLEPARLAHMQEIPARFIDPVDGYGAVMNYGALGAVYNGKTIATPPKSWKDFVEGVVAGKYKAMMPSINYPAGGVYALWMYSALYGGSTSNVSAGLAQIKRMVASGNLKFWTDANQVLNGLKSGEIDIAMYWDGRAWAFIDDNPSFKYYTPEPGGVAAPTFMQKVKNSPDLAWEFIDVAMTAEPQACFANKIRYGVSNKNAVYDPKVKHQITDLTLLLAPPYQEFPKYQSQWVEQWNKEVGR